MYKKKILITIIALIICLNMPNSVDAVIETGSCGENANWSFNTDTGELIISGTGDMANYTHTKTCGSFVDSTGCVSTAPWGNYSTSVTAVSISEGITAIGDWALHNCRFTSLKIPDSVTYIGASAIKFCMKLTELTIPEKVTHIARYAFDNCLELASVKFLGTNDPKWTGDIGSAIFFDDCDKLESVLVRTNYNNDTFCDHPVQKIIPIATFMFTPKLKVNGKKNSIIASFFIYRHI